MARFAYALWLKDSDPPKYRSGDGSTVDTIFHSKSFGDAGSALMWGMRTEIDKAAHAGIIPNDMLLEVVSVESVGDPPYFEIRPVNDKQKRMWTEHEPENLRKAHI